MWEEAEERRLEAVERTWKSLGIARRIAARHGYMDGEGGEQRWKSTARRGSGEDRDMSGDALTAWQREKWKQLLVAEDMWRTWAGVTVVGEEGVAKAQCALSTLRNLLRNEEASVEVLVEHQAGGAWKGQYHFPDWSKVIHAAKLVRAGEEMVTFRPDQMGGPAELWDVRVMAFVTTEPYQHVVAVVKGTRCFRLYDNDGAERGMGRGRVVTVESMAGWKGVMHAVVVKGARVVESSHAPRIVPRARGPGATRETCISV